MRQALWAGVVWPGVLRALAIAGAILAVVILSGAIGQIGKPFAGFRYEPTLTLSQQNDVAWEGIKRGLAPYDRLLTANGQPLLHADDLAGLVAGVPVGTDIRYDLLRDGKQLSYVVPTQEYRLADFLRNQGPFLLVGLACLLIGTLTFWIKPGHAAARANFIACLVLGLFSLFGVDFDGARWMPEIYLLATPFLIGACLHLAAVAPEPRPFFARHPWAAYLGYAPSAAIGIYWYLTYRPVGEATDPAAVQAYLDMVQLVLALLLASLLLFVGSIGAAAGRAPTPQQRLQAKTILIGLAAGFLPSALVSIVPQLLGRASDMSYLLTNLSVFLWLLWPLSISYSVVKHRMFDIDAALRRTMVYVLLVSTLTVVYVATLVTVGGALERFFGGGAGIAPNAAATAIIAVLFEPLRERARALVDRLFYRTGYDFQRIVTDFGDRARGMYDPVSLAEEFARTVDQSLHPEFVVVLLKPEGSRELIQACALGYVFATPLVVSLDNFVMLAALSTAASEKRETFDFPGLGDVVLLPLVLKDDLLGCVLCGPKKSGADYLEQDWLLVRNLGQQLAVWLKNSRLFEQLANRAKELQDLVRLYEQAHLEALTDPLTGLYNRRAFHDQVGKLLAGAERKKAPLSVILLDIDHFKRFNDTYGHASGDLAIRFVSDLLRQTVRASDVAARWGGEEFIVCLPETTLRDALLVGERICARSAARDLFREDGSPLPRVTVSVGVAWLHHGQETLETLIARADQALYVAKAKGRNQVQTLELDGVVPSLA
ncbi:MAG: diguanylate cyclase [Candidatus Sericytochromatia bacterium]|nr:diguanylate cyclase [Candidatus Tanganyikabacteria bacterium]